MIQKNDYVRVKNGLYRVLAIKDDSVQMIECRRRTMPDWHNMDELLEAEMVIREDALSEIGIDVRTMDELTSEELRQAHERYTMIAGVLAFLQDDILRNQAITEAIQTAGVSRRTITNYLCLYLVTDSISVLADKRRNKEKALTQDEKNMRWALNKFYYTRHKNNLTDAYVMMLKEKYTYDGKLLLDRPSIYQFRYFFNKTRKKQSEIISREGIKEYKLNYRPLLGDGVQAFAPTIGTVALDATICDLYLVDNAGKLVGRPILVAAVDMHCGMVCGYSLLWEGGVYSVRELMLNVITDKVAWCKQHGILITKDEWNCQELPGVIVTDRGSEYISYNFEQIVELGCKVISLESFSANMKSQVEKFFDLCQSSFVPYLHGRGVLEADYQKRGIRDYRKDACLTMEQFEQIILRCILYHNNGRILENYPFTEKMMDADISPYAAAIWNFGREQEGANLIPVSKEQLLLTLLPRTEGKFSRYGLRVNKMRYHAEGYTEAYLKGGSVTVAYNPDDVSYVYILPDYKKFSLIEKRFSGKTLEEVQDLQRKKKEHTRSYAEEALQAKVELAQHIEAIASQSVARMDTEIEGVRKRRQKARADRHTNLLKEIESNHE